MTTPTAPEDFGPTGYCRNRNHKKCPYTTGGKLEHGLNLSNGEFYMCPCSCHDGQRDADGQVMELEGTGLPADTTNPTTVEAVAATVAEIDRLAAEGDTDTAAAHVVAGTGVDPSQEKEMATTKRAPAKKAAAKKATPRKTAAKTAARPAAKAVAAKPKKDGLTNHQQQGVRRLMANVLDEMLARFDELKVNDPELAEVTRKDAAVYLEGRWLKYIDPDKDRARLQEWREQRTA
jgi:hypothetical protein